MSRSGMAIQILMAPLLLLGSPSALSAADLINRAVNSVINSVDPNGDASSRRVAEEAVRATVSPTSDGSQRHIDHMEQEAQRGLSQGAGDNSGSKSSAASGDYGGGSEPLRVAAADGSMVCPKGGERYSSDYAFCPKHGVKLENASGGSDRYTDAKTGIEFVRVQGGCFVMGSRDGEQGAEEDEKPAHEVCVDGFWIGRFEVTQAQWQGVMGGNPSSAKGGDRPVENVSWRDAQEFVSRIGSATGKRYRLPTEAEWEFAARGGVKSQGFKFSGSNSVNHVGWFSENSGGATVPVGRKDPNELGIHDMSGNVWEWCEDWYEKNYYRWSPKMNPPGPDQGSYRVYRGGCWFYLAGYLRVAYRRSGDPGNRGDSLGFRLALSQ